MIKTKKNGELIIVSGTTCAGKDTIVKKVLEKNKNITLATSYTSRPIRPGEKEGVNYYFVTNEQFEEKIKNDEFLEYAKVQYGAYYGTPKKEVVDILNSGKDVILVIDVQGAQIIKEKFPETLLIFILAPSMNEIKKRLINRGTETKEQIIERFKLAYNEINEVNKYNEVTNYMDWKTTIKYLQTYIKEKDYHPDLLKDYFLKLSEEVGELSRAMRKGLKAQNSTDILGTVDEELWDVIYYALAIANIYDIDIEQVAKVKSEMNESRYPSKVKFEEGR